MAERAQRSLDAQRHHHPPQDTTSNPSTSASASSSALVTPRSSEEHARPIPAPRSPSIRVSSPLPHNHRHSFSDTLRGVVPPSPRSSRHFSSASLAAVQDLLNNPPKASSADPAFTGRDWHSITAGELVDPSEIEFVEVDTGIEEATHTLIENGASALLVRSTPGDKAAVATFDYKDLNQYLLFATGSLRPDEEHRAFFQNLAKKAQAGIKIPIREAKSLGSKEPFVILPHTAKLTKALEAFGGGVHRLIVVKEWTNEVVGVLSQFRLVKFLWENGGSFPVIDQLYQQQIRDLGVGERRSIVAINGDKPLREALLLLDYEGVTSLAVVDNQYNVVGNISTADVKLLTKASSAPLLDNTCIHFISVILSARGLNDGKDSFPVFYISPYSTLAHTVAKLVATRSHRMWVTTPPSPSPSNPPTPGPAPYSTGPFQPPFPPHTPTPGNTPVTPNFPSSLTSPPPQPSANLSSNPSLSNPLSPISSHSPSSHAHFPGLGAGPGSGAGAGYSAMPPLIPTSSSPSVSAASLPGAALSGRLSGVVSLTDILNLFARASGLHPADPGDSRRERRRGSSASSNSERGGRIELG